MSKRLTTLLLMVLALIGSREVFAHQMVERSGLPPLAEKKAEPCKQDSQPSGNPFLGEPRTELMRPLSEGFEGGVIPADWTVYNEDGDSYQWEVYSTTSAHGGDYVARVHHNSSGCDDWLVTPKLVCNAGTADTLKFWAYSYSSYYPEDFELWISTTGNTIGDFTDMVYSYLNHPNLWIEHKIPLDIYDGNDIYAAVRCVSVQEYYLYLDDFKGPEIWVPPLPAISFNTKDLGFGPIVIGDSASLPLIIYSTGGIDLTVSDINSDNGHFTHDFPGIPQVILPGDSLVVTVTFTPTAELEETATLTVTHDAAKVESYISMSGYGYSGTLFQDFGGIFPPPGWAEYQLGDPAGWMHGTSGCDDLFCAFHDDDNVTTGCDDWLVTPQMSLPAKSAYKLEFMQYEKYSSYYEYHGVMISTSSGDPNDGQFVELYEIGSGTEDTWEAVEDISLVAYTGQDIHLAFRYQGDYADEWSVDNVVVQEYIYVNEPPEITHDHKGDTEDTTPTITAIITDVEEFTASVFYETALKVFSEAPMSLAGVLRNEYSVELPTLSYGTINYYIQATDDSGMVSTNPPGAPGEYYSFDIQEFLGLELIYDDGTVENATYWSPTYENGRFAVQFTPPVYPCTLNAVKLGIFTDWPDETHQQLAVEIYDDDGVDGAPGTMIYGPDTTGSIGNVVGGLPSGGTSPPYTLDWAYVCIHPTLVITNGDFYVAKAQITVAPKCEALEMDQDGDMAHRSWKRDPTTGVWSEYADANGDSANFMIRAYTRQALTTGDLEGHVYESTKTPIAGAIATAVGDLVTIFDTTDASCYYSFNDLPIGDYDVTLEAGGYHSETVEDVAVVEDSITIQDFYLVLDTALLRESFCDVFPPASWTEYQLYDQAGWQKSTSGHDDACCAWHDDDDVVNLCDDWLVTPAISIPADKAEYALDFYEYRSYFSFYHYHGVWISAGSGDPSIGGGPSGYGDFIELQEIDYGSGYAWEEIGPISMAAFEGQTIYLAFVYQGDYADDWKIDDVVICAQPPVPVELVGSAAAGGAAVPKTYALHQNYPNPFNPTTEIKYAIPKDAHVTLKVYNVLGAEVATLVDAHQKANFYTVRWDADELASGMYFCWLKAGAFEKTIKMVFLK